MKIYFNAKIVTQIVRGRKSKPTGKEAGVLAKKQSFHAKVIFIYLIGKVRYVNPEMNISCVNA